jgi:hypothetical protein
VKLRSSVAAVLVVTSIAQTPLPAHAQETPTNWLVKAPTPIDLRLTGLARAPSTMSSDDAPRLSPFAPAPADIRLSRGAKTAIIVGAIVVGALLIVGVVVLAKPGKHL